MYDGFRDNVGAKLHPEFDKLQRLEEEYVKTAEKPDVKQVVYWFA